MQSSLSKSKFVTEGHPRKIWGVISDAMPDACLEHDSESEIARNIGAKRVKVFGRISTNAIVNYEQIV